jgi:hypothetical protein
VCASGRSVGGGLLYVGNTAKAIEGYVEFCANFAAELAPLPMLGPLRRTSCGDVYISETGVNAYLIGQLEVKKVAAVIREFGKLKLGLRSSRGVVRFGPCRTNNARGGLVS